MQVAKKIDVPFHEVDAHNIVPVWEASDKRETGARTIRSKINRQLGEYLEVCPKTDTSPHSFQVQSDTNVDNEDRPHHPQQGQPAAGRVPRGRVSCAESGPLNVTPSQSAGSMLRQSSHFARCVHAGARPEQAIVYSETSIILLNQFRLHSSLYSSIICFSCTVCLRSSLSWKSRQTGVWTPHPST